MSEYFSKPTSLGGRVKVELCNYATKTYLKSATGVNILSVAKKN